MGIYRVAKSSWEREFTLDEYKEYRLGILEDLYISLDDYQKDYLNSLTTFNDVDKYLHDVIMDSKQNQGPKLTTKQVVNKAYNKETVNKKRTLRNAAKKAAREKHAVL